MAIVKDIVADYGADPTGVADIGTPALVNLHTDMIGQDAEVTFPPGDYNWTTNGTTWINGVLDLDIIATGANVSGNGVFLQTSHLTQVGIDSASGKSARIQTVNSGATSLSLTSASAAAGHISRFSIGQAILVTGWPTQALFQSAYSFPPNWQFIDHVTITNIVGDTITFTPALRNYYSDQWPEMNRGGAFEVDAAGPATIFALSPFWQGTTTVTGGTWTRGDLINCYRENFIMNGGTSGNLPIYPSVSKLWRAINHTATVSSTEHDKLNDWVDIQGGNYKVWKCQSGSTRLLTMTGTTMTGLDGTVEDTVLDGCTVNGNVNLGPTAYGRGNKLTLTNTYVSGTLQTGLVETGPASVTVPNYMFKTGDVLTIPLAANDAAVRWSMPDAAGRNVVWWRGASGTMGYFRILSATSDLWPAVDNQTATTDVSITFNTKDLTVSTSIFSLSDVWKCILIPGAAAGGNTLKTFITSYISPTQVTICHPAGSTLSASSRNLQWGTCNVYLTTDSTDPIPAGATNVWVPGVRKIRFENCTGSDTMVDLSQSAAWDKPPFSYTKRTYTSQPTTNSYIIPMHGSVQSLKINVTKAYTGVGSLTAGIGQFGVGTYQGGSVVFYNPRVNLKVLGERVIAVGSTTGTQSGDTNLDLSVPAWVVGSIFSVMSRDISGEPSGDYPEYTIEMITDQGFPVEVPAAVMPLRFRLRLA